MRVYCLTSLPRNFDEFAAEISRGVGGLYGRGAQLEYQRKAAPAFEAMLRNAAVDLLACDVEGVPAGLLVVQRRPGAGRITLLHVLQRFEGAGAESSLVEEAVARLRAERMPRIISECVTFCRIDPGPAYAALGFEPFPHVLMTKPLDPGPEGPARSEPLLPAHWDAAAEVLVRAYEQHPLRRMHPELETIVHARGLVMNTYQGMYGLMRPGFSRIAFHNGAPVGVTLACQCAPDTGFVLHIAVTPPCQRQGLGARLLDDTERQFAAFGMTKSALGVAVDNPARRLYRRAGYVDRKHFSAYLWCRGNICRGREDAALQDMVD